MKLELDLTGYLTKIGLKNIENRISEVVCEPPRVMMTDKEIAGYWAVGVHKVPLILKRGRYCSAPRLLDGN